MIEGTAELTCSSEIAKSFLDASEETSSVVVVVVVVVLVAVVIAGAVVSSLVVVTPTVLTLISLMSQDLLSYDKLVF